MRLLFVTERIPFPLHSGTAILTWHTLDFLGTRHDVDVIAYPATAEGDDGLGARIHRRVLAPPHRLRARRVRQIASLVGRRGAIEAVTYDAAYLRTLEDLLARETYDAIVVDHLRMGWTLPTVVARGGAARVLFRSHNCEADVRRLYVRHVRNPIAALPLRLEEWKTRRYEERIVGAADAVIAITEEDAALHRAQGARRVFVAPPGFEFAPEPRPAGGPGKIRGSLVLMGSFEYLAKEINAAFLVTRVFPLVKARVPDAQLFLVGAGPSARLRRIAAAAGGVTVTGRVPDAHEVACRCEVFVMPTVVGGGFELKGLEAVGLRLPIVATPLAKQGLALVPGKSILVGNDEAELADRILELLASEERRRLQAEAAFREASTRYTWEAAGARVAEALEATCRGGSLPSVA